MYICVYCTKYVTKITCFQEPVTYTPTTCSRWYDHEWLKADYKPDSSIHPGTCCTATGNSHWGRSWPGVFNGQWGEHCYSGKDKGCGSHDGSRCGWSNKGRAWRSREVSYLQWRGRCRWLGGMWCSTVWILDSPELCGHHNETRRPKEKDPAEIWL